MRLAALIKCGQLCRECRGGQCKDEGRKRLECVSCAGKGCDKCSDGHEVIEGCSQKQAAPMYEAVSMFELAEKGLMPIGGGLLDQAKWFVEAYRFYSHEVDRIKAEMMK